MSDLPADVVELVACPGLPVPVDRLPETAFRANAWSPSEIATLRQMFTADTGLDEMATILDRPRHGLRSKIHELGLRRNSSRPWSTLDDEELVRSYGTVSAAAIAAGLLRGVVAVYARARLLGLAEAAMPPWTPWEDAQLAAAYSQGVAVAQVAVLIGRTLGAVATRACDRGIRHRSQPADWTNTELARLLSLAETGARYLAIIETMVDEGFPRRTKAAVGPQLRKLGYGRGWGRPWDDGEDALLRHCYSTGESLTPLVTRMGRSRCSIRWRSEYLGLRGTHANRDGFRGGPLWTTAELDRLRAAYGTMPVKDLAAELGRKKAAIYTRANVLGLKHPFMRAFTADDDAAIRTAWSDGTPLSALARTMQRDVAVVSKHAIRLGIAFNDPARPVRPDRRRRDANS